MANPVITNNDTSQLEVFNPKYIHGKVTFSGADTFVLGTILAKKTAATIAVVAGTNTGDGTATATLSQLALPVEGSYVLECETAVINGGIFSLTSPSGVVLKSDITIPAGAGASIVYEGFGLIVTITDGTDDFAAGDSFSINVSAITSKFVPYTASGTFGANVAKAILAADLTATGAGDKFTTAILVEGEVDKDKLVIDDGSVVNAGVIAQLLDAGIIVRTADTIDVLDNQ